MSATQEMSLHRAFWNTFKSRAPTMYADFEIWFIEYKKTWGWHRFVKEDFPIEELPPSIQLAICFDHAAHVGDETEFDAYTSKKELLSGLLESLVGMECKRMFDKI